ncbi:MAG: UbiA family prenyltransferase [Chitinophagaceae bacterium]
MPVYLFALSQLPQLDWADALLIFIILHFLVYPASNAYNSYMDRDEKSIGGVKKPLLPTKQLFHVSMVMDGIALLLSLVIDVFFAVGVLLYILASRAYSYRGIRLKRYPLIGYIVVIIFQGGVTFWLVYHGSHPFKSFQVPVSGLIASSLLIGGFYPLTQVYQHQADKDDGVVTISMMLGYRGTFIFTGIVYAVAFAVLAWHFISGLEPGQFLLLQIFLIPVLVYFFMWAAKVWKDTGKADFENTMRMNILASGCTNAAFLILIIWRLNE